MTFEEPSSATPGNPAMAKVRSWVGVEVETRVIRAAVFSPGMDLLGKMKLSTKPERGMASVVERVGRCIRYAVDECDLSPGEIGAVGVGLPADLAEDGTVAAWPGMGWEQVRVRDEMEAVLGLPVRCGNVFSLAAWAVHALEIPGHPGSLAVLFPGGVLGAGLVVDGAMVSLSAWPKDSPVLPPGSANIVGHTADSRFRGMRARDFRRAVRKGDQAAVEFLRGVVAQAAEFAATLIRRGAVDRLALGGGAIDENKVEMLGTFNDALRRELGDDSVVERTQPFVSALGDRAGAMGAARFAAEKLGATGGEQLVEPGNCASA